MVRVRGCLCQPHWFSILASSSYRFASLTSLSPRRTWRPTKLTPRTAAMLSSANTFLISSFTHGCRWESMNLPIICRAKYESKQRADSAPHFANSALRRPFVCTPWLQKVSCVSLTMKLPSKHRDEIANSYNCHSSFEGWRCHTHRQCRYAIDQVEVPDIDHPFCNCGGASCEERFILIRSWHIMFFHKMLPGLRPHRKAKTQNMAWSA